MRLAPKTIGNLVKLTIFAVITAIVTAVLAFAIADTGIGGQFTTYRANFTDVTALLTGDDVRIAGVRVGQVQAIKLVHDRYAQVTFTVDRDVPVYVSATAQIQYLNLIGQRYLAIDEAPGSADRLPPNGLIPLSRTSPALDLTTLFNGFKPLFEALNPQDVNTLAYEIIQTLQGESGTLDSLVTNTASLTNTIADRTTVIDEVINNLDGVLATVDQRDAGLSQLIVQMQRLVTGLADDRGTIAASLGNINDLAVSTASLISDIRPSLPGDLAGLNGVASALATTTNSNGANTFDAFLQNFPSKLNTIIRTATYGSWFNYYLCDANYEANGQLSSVRVHVNIPACSAGGS
jgi:phospholipid/cholesterol/gamma-HCH transport system substrate-binding protein